MSTEWTKTIRRTSQRSDAALSLLAGHSCFNGVLLNGLPERTCTPHQTGITRAAPYIPSSTTATAQVATILPSPTDTAPVDVFPEVWSSNGYDGQTHEYKTNCFGAYPKLEDCPLSVVTRVVVLSPDGDETALEKDFNINVYSGEVTRRWVLYGAPGKGLPVPGEYKFLYYLGSELVLEQKVQYELDVIDFPRDVSWRRDGSALVVSWTPPHGVKAGMWYKVLVFPQKGDLISQVFDWQVSMARLPNIPLRDGDHAQLNVAVYFDGGYAYSERIPVVW